ncbi:MAG: L,D-transpeptidase family protein [Coprococcus sp.]|nr:L,D-transpeptidase family protein [Coprococcus sp.]
MSDEVMKREENTGEGRPDEKEEIDGSSKSQNVEESIEKAEAPGAIGNDISGNELDSQTAAGEFPASEKEDVQSGEKNEKGIKSPVKKKAPKKNTKRRRSQPSVKPANEEENILSAEDGEELDGTDEGFTLDEDGAEELEPTLSVEDGEELDSLLNAADEEELESILDTEDEESFEEYESDDEDEDEDEQEEDEQEEEMTEEERAERKRKRRKVLKILGLSVLGTVAAVYGGISVFFMSHFYYNTTINGVDFSMKSVTDVEDYMAQQVEGYSLTLEKSDGGSETVTGTDISISYEKSDELKKLMDEQNAFLWPKGLWEKQDISASIGVSYNQEQLNTVLAALPCMQAENQTPPVSSTPEFDGTEFVPKEEEVGSQIEPEIFTQKVNESISGFQDTLNMTEESCYVKPVYTKESPEVQEACNQMNQYLAASVTYTFGSAQEVVDRTVISQWVTTDENMAVTFHSDMVSQYVQGLADKYNTYKTQRTFTAGNGNTVNVEGGDYGWILDTETENQALLTSIQNGEVVTKEPAYKQRAASHDGADWGGTYVEVDLTNQNFYLFVDGALVISGPIVTGKPSAGDATPQGVYLIKYCQRGATLRGPKQPDGSYEWESPVSFWMPFNGGIGLHDAPWQAAFGGSRYLTHGSHGCVNLQYNAAQTIFNNVQAGTPVVCHY